MIMAMPTLFTKSPFLLVCDYQQMKTFSLTLFLDTFEEFSHTEETGSVVEATSEHLLSHPDLEDDEKDWEYDLDGNHEGDVTPTWDEDNEEADKSTSNASSTTLSSKASKRGFEEVDSDGEDYENGDSQHWSPAGSPGMCFY